MIPTVVEVEQFVGQNRADILVLEVCMSKLTTTDLRPFVPAKSFAESKEFYTSLGWKVKDLSAALALVQLGERSFYLQDYFVEEFAQNTMLHITVEDAQAWYEHVSSIVRTRKFAEARVQPPKRQAYGAVVTFVHDPAGVLLHLCQWDKQ
jgi:catechol 2,3-dioxygenase-like lactoylglutathione lyase family enzyme